MTTTWIITTTSQVSALVDLGRAVGGTVSVVALGQVSVPGVDSVVGVELADGVPPEAAAPAVVAAVAAVPGDVVLAPDRPVERVLACAVAAHLNAPVLTHVVGCADGTFEVARFGGIAQESVAVSGPVVVVMNGGAEATGDAVPVAPAAALGVHPARIARETSDKGSEVDLASAKRIVSVGRGFKAREDLRLAEELAEALGAEVACSRPLAEGVDWMPKSRYVGISGQTVHPDLYLAIGISGQMQHIAGASGARTIVAINSDAQAPIFGEADYGLVADLYEAVPAVTAALR